MKRVIALFLSLVLCLTVFTAVSAEGALTVELVPSKAEIGVGDSFSVDVVLKNNTSKELRSFDIAVFYNSSVVSYDATKPVALTDDLKDKGMSAIYTKNDDSVVRFAAGFAPDKKDEIPAKVEESAVIATLNFKAIAEGDAKLSFAVEGKAAKISLSLPEGCLVYTTSLTNEDAVELSAPELLIGEGQPMKVITEILETKALEVPVGTSADEVVKLLPSFAKVKLDDGTEVTVSMSWTPGSLISGYDATTPGKYYFTGSIAEPCEYFNYNGLFSMVEVTVKGEGTENSGAKVDEKIDEKPEIKIIMTIGSDEPTVNGEIVKIDVPAFIEESRTFTPARFVAESLGANVEWDDATKTVTITDGDTIIKLVINSNIAIVNGEEVEIDVPAFIRDSRTFTPARFVAEALGANVEWDDATKVVTVTK